MKSLTLLLLFFSFQSIFAQDSVSVLFIGNSYTYVNDLPTVFTALTNSLGDIATVDSKTNGGYTFQNQLDDPLTHTKIHSKPWDFVVLQGQSQEPSFPTDQVNQMTLPPAVSLADSVYSNRYCSQAMYFMTWGRQFGDPQWDSINTFDKMNGRLRDAYLRISDSAMACVSPVGVAWKYVRDNYPSINLYAADGSHPSPEGTYLAACTFYAAVFRQSPSGASYVFGLDPTVAGQLQAAAALVVLDSLDTWHLRATPDLAIAQFEQSTSGNVVTFYNTSWHAQSVEWDFGDGSTSLLNDPVHTYSTGGNYTVRLVALSECGNDTVYQQLGISASGINEVVNEPGIIRSTGNGHFVLEGLNGSCELLNMQGQKISGAHKMLNDGSIEIDLSFVPKGIYLFILVRDQQRISYRLVNF